MDTGAGNLKVTNYCIPYSFPAPCGGGCWQRAARGFAPHTVSAPTPVLPRSRDSSAGTPAAPPGPPEHCSHTHGHTHGDRAAILGVFSFVHNKCSIVTLMFPAKTSAGDERVWPDLFGRSRNLSYFSTHHSTLEAITDLTKTPL